MTSEQRQAARQRKQDRDTEQFFAAIMAEFPSMPESEAKSVAHRACQVGSGRVGRTRTIPTEVAVELAVRAHVRHMYTDYDDYLNEKMLHAFDREERDDIRAEARDFVRSEIDRILVEWRISPPAMPCEDGDADRPVPGDEAMASDPGIENIAGKGGRSDDAEE